MHQYWQLLRGWLLSSGIQIGIIVVGAFIVLRVFKLIVHKSKRKLGAEDRFGVERAKRAETLARIVETTARVVVLIAALLMVLREIGIDIGPLLAGAGVVGLAVGFGAQSLVKDVISGFFILLENHMNVGDVVKIAGEAGLVESINLRVTVLRDLAGNVHIVPNGEITTVTNMTKEWSRALLDIGVAYKENVDEVMAVLREIGDGMTKDARFGSMILEPLEMLGVEEFADSSVNIRVMIKTQPIKQWAVAREFRRRVKNTFDERGIEIPFPHVTLYMGEGENEGVLKVRTTAGSPGERPEG